MDPNNPGDVAARYEANPEYWVDIPEADPRCRLRSTSGTVVPVTVTKDGALHYDKERAEYSDYSDVPGWTG